MALRRFWAVLTVVVLAVAGLAAPAYAAAYGTVRGTYLTDDGRPIAGATVYTTNVDGARATRVGNTDALGRYLVVDVPPGRVTVQFHHDGITQYAPRTGDPDAAGTFAVVAGLTTTVDERQLPTGDVRGRITTAAGAPVESASVAVTDPRGATLRAARTDADGRYAIAGVPAGPVLVRFFAGDVHQWAHGAADRAAATPFTVVAGQTLTVDDARVPTGTIAGRLTAPGGGPGDASVSAVRADGGASVFRGTDADGRFSIEVPAGQWRLRIARGVTTPQWAPGRADEAEGAIYTVAAGQTVTVDDELLPTGSISGRMADANGRGLSDADVVLWRGGVKVVTAYTDEDGGYAFPHVLPGVYHVATQRGSTDFFLPGSPRADRAAEYTVRAGEHLTVDGRAPAPGVLAGRLTLPDGGPAAGLRVDIAGVPGTPGLAGYTWTAADGTWRFEYVFPEEYVVTYASSDRALRQPAAGTHTVRSGATTTVDGVWRTGASVTVAAVDAATGAPVSDYCVSAAERFGTFCTEGASVTVAGLAAGSSTLTVSPARNSDYVSATTPVTVAGNEQASVTVPLTLGGRLNTLVVDRVTGEPVERACVALVAPGAGGITESFGDCTNKQGKLTTHARPEGTYQVFVKAPYGHGAQWVAATGGTGDQREATRFRIRAGRTLKAGTVLLDRAGTVTGTVRDPAGRPVPSVNVDVTAWDLAAGPAYGSVATDAQGRYSLRTLGPYAWPLLFTPVDTLPRQWSGGVANRFRAEPVTVPAGGAATTYDVTLRAGAELTGTVTVTGGPYAGGRLTAVNPATGDQLAQAGFPGAGGPYVMPVSGGGPVRIGWYLASPGAQASGGTETVTVPRTGTRRLDLTAG